MTPSAPGKTTVAFNSAFFKGQAGFGMATAHRLRMFENTPVILNGAVSYAGGKYTTGRVGVAFEF